eukprot:COSAG05_NODE_14598_length_392_cov_1.317406_2_plen_61_part_01
MQAAAEGGVDRDWLERTNADLREGVMGSTQQQQSLRNQVRPRVCYAGQQEPHFFSSRRRHT